MHRYKFIKYIEDNYHSCQIANIKTTARAPYTFLAGTPSQKFLIVAAFSDIQKFYLHRSIKMQRLLYHDYKTYFVFNFPIKISRLFGFDYAVYRYYPMLSQCNDERPCEFLDNLYAGTFMVKITNGVIEKIEKEFLASWPKIFHEEIKSLPSYARYFKSISESDELLVYKEHGDYNVENILRDKEGKYYLMDFEFSKLYQPVGIDKADYYLSLYGTTRGERSGELKQDLYNDINRLIDKKKNYSLIRRIDHFLFYMSIWVCHFSQVIF